MGADDHANRAAVGVVMGLAPHEPLDAAAPRLLAHELDVAVGLELAHVIGDPLAGEAERPRDGGRRARFIQRVQDALSHRRGQEGGVAGIADDLDGGHGATLSARSPFDKNFSNDSHGPIENPSSRTTSATCGASSSNSRQKGASATSSIW